MQVAQNICQLSAEGRIEIVEKNRWREQEFVDIQRLIKGPKTHVFIILGIFDDTLQIWEFCLEKQASEKWLLEAVQEQ